MLVSTAPFPCSHQLTHVNHFEVKLVFCFAAGKLTEGEPTRPSRVSLWKPLCTVSKQSPSCLDLWVPPCTALLCRRKHCFFLGKTMCPRTGGTNGAPPGFNLLARWNSPRSPVTPTGVTKHGTAPRRLAEPWGCSRCLWPLDSPRAAAGAQGRMEFLGATQVASYCGRRKGCLFPDLAPTSTTKDTYQSYCLPGYRYLNSWRPSQLHKVVLVPDSSDKEFNSTGRPPTVLPALRSSLHARYSTRDWHHANMVQLKGSEASRYCAGRLNADSMRLMQNKDQLTYLMQEDSRRSLGERITNIDFWRSELIYELECLLKETQALETAKQRLQCAADALQGPLKVGLTQLVIS